MSKFIPAKSVRREQFQQARRLAMRAQALKRMDAEFQKLQEESGTTTVSRGELELLAAAKEHK